MAHLKCLKTYYLPCSSSSKLHSCIQSQDCRPLQNIVKYYTKCTNPMKRMEQSRNVEKALDCDKNTYRPSFRVFESSFGWSCQSTNWFQCSKVSFFWSAKRIWFRNILPYPCSHFYFDIKFGDRLYSKENRPGSLLLFWI